MVRHLTRVDDFTKKDCSEIFKLASEFESGGDFRNLHDGKMLEIAFFMASNRTIESFKDAMKNLGGNSKISVSKTTNISNEYVIKTLRSLISGSDIMAVRYENQDLRFFYHSTQSSNSPD